jgi:hypothetical protein
VRGTLNSSEDLYRTLQVEPSADLEAIHAAYRRLARLYHPDLNPRPEAAARMSAINAAYRVLSDPRRRAEYDARRYLRPAASTMTAVRPRTRPVVVKPPPEPASELQRRVDRIVAVLGILLIIGIGLYAVLVIPRAEQQFSQYEARGLRPPSSTPAVAPRGTDANLPPRLLADPGLRSFPGTVLVPPTDLVPFKNLPIMRLDATSQGIARYAVYYGDITTGVASVSGLTGRTSFDNAAPRLPDCAPEATYCAGPGVGQGPNDPPGVELFRPQHLVGNDPAFATHRVCCNGVSWSLNWFDQATNMSYTIDLSRNVAMQYGGSSASNDVDAARTVGALAAQLVRLP